MPALTMKACLTAIGILALAPAALLAQIGATTGLSPEGAIKNGAISLAALPPGAVYEWTEESPMGCRVTFKARNYGKTTIELDWYLSRVRTRLGTWKKLDSRREERVVTAGRSFSEYKRVDRACNARRRYDFALKKMTKEHMTHRYYHPSSRGFTQNTTIDLGDLNRFFR